MPKGCICFVGMINFLSMFCPELQRLLKPIYDLTRKGRPFIWEEEQQEAFEEIKRRLVKAPVSHMPNHESRFHLYSNTSKFAVGSALYQIQNGKPKLIAYASKRLPELEAIPISFNMYNVSYQTYYRIEPSDRYLVQMLLI